MKNDAEIAPDEPAAERNDYDQVILPQGLGDALARLNPALPAEALTARRHLNRVLRNWVSSEGPARVL